MGKRYTVCEGRDESEGQPGIRWRGQGENGWRIRVAPGCVTGLSAVLLPQLAVSECTVENRVRVRVRVWSEGSTPVQSREERARVSKSNTGVVKGSIPK